MIYNERQYKITKEQLQKIMDALEHFDRSEPKASLIDPKILKAQKDALRSQYESLLEELRDYERIKAGDENISELSDLSDLPKLLIKARISQGLSQTDLAKLLGMKPQQIQRYEVEEYASASITRLLQIANVLGLSVKKSAQVGLKKEEHLWEKFPVKEMYQKGWFLGFDGSYKQLISNIEEHLNNFLISAGTNPQLAFHRKTHRAGSEIDNYALHAWETRVIQQALLRPCETCFSISQINDGWLKSLVALSTSPEGPRLVKNHLCAVGIDFVIEPHLQGTLLDGAALRLPNGNPLVAMTLRYDRLDNFWFVLLHEVAHVIKHLSTNKDVRFFDDLDNQSQEEAMEKEANDFASEALIPSDQWENSLARFMATPNAVENQAKAWGISPAIIAGRIRQEQQNWLILNELVGKGQVRCQFPEVVFTT